MPEAHRHLTTGKALTLRNVHHSHSYPRDEVPDNIARLVGPEPLEYRETKQDKLHPLLPCYGRCEAGANGLWERTTLLLIWERPKARLPVELYGYCRRKATIFRCYLFFFRTFAVLSTPAVLYGHHSSTAVHGSYKGGG